MNKSRPTRQHGEQTKSTLRRWETPLSFCKGKMQASAISSKTVPGQSCNSLKKRLQGQGKKCKDTEEHKGQKRQGSDILLGMWKPEVDAHSYKLQSSRNSKELTQERWEIKSARKQNWALHEYWVLSVIACFLAWLLCTGGRALLSPHTSLRR